MAFGQTTLFAQLSEAIAGQVAAAAPLLAAIRVGPNRHVTGIVWQRDLVITSDQALPALDSFTLVLSGGILTAGRPARRNATSNIASLRLEAPVHPAQILPPAEPRVGALALALGADVDAAPMVRLAVIHKVNGSRGDNADRSLTLDMPASLVAEGRAGARCGGRVARHGHHRRQQRGDRHSAQRHGSPVGDVPSAGWPARLARCGAATDHRS